MARQEVSRTTHIEEGELRVTHENAILTNITTNSTKVNEKVTLHGDFRILRYFKRWRRSAKIRCGWKKFKDMASVLCKKVVSLKLRGSTYNGCVKSALCIAAECRVSKKQIREN